MNLKLLIKKLKSAKLDDKILEVVRGNQSQIIDLNLLQLDSGRTSTDKSIKPPYQNPKYAEMKKHLNPKGVVDLKLTGEFWAGFFVKADKFPITFGSTDEKSNELEDKYGKDIFGLGKEGLSETKAIVLPEVQKYFRGLLHV